MLGIFLSVFAVSDFARECCSGASCICVAETEFSRWILGH